MDTSDKNTPTIQCAILLIQKNGVTKSPNSVIDQLSDCNVKPKYSLQGTTQGRYLTGGVLPVRFSM